MLAFLLLGSAHGVAAQSPCWRRVELLGSQVTAIAQDLLPLTSPYAGPKSLAASGDAALSHSYGAYAGACLTPRLAVYLDAEMIRGGGISHAQGLAGVTNGDVIRQGSTDLGSGPYVARLFARYILPLGGTREDTLIQAMDRLPAILAARRIEITAGRLTLTDIMDENRYAASTREQFMNWTLINNGAWDYAANTRGYSNGVAVAFVTPGWSLTVASFQMPLMANGNDFDGDVARARGDNVELVIGGEGHAHVRILAYENHGRMGRYAVDSGLTAVGVPFVIPTRNVAADDAPGRTKTGFAINAELPLADSGETGLFTRLGWNDGKTESFVFTEADGHASAGGQLTGSAWHRPADRLGVALVLNLLWQPHRAYLEAGGTGFLLGDGRLNYGPETILEAYYRLQLGKWVQCSPDVQLIANPGYNRDRGPATVLSLRLRAAI